jgi:hypothetical protein
MRRLSQERLIFERVNVREGVRISIAVMRCEVAFSVDLGGRRNYSNEKFEDRSRERFQANVVRT